MSASRRNILWSPVDNWAWHWFEDMISGQPVPFTLPIHKLPDGRVGYVDHTKGRGAWVLAGGLVWTCACLLISLIVVPSTVGTSQATNAIMVSAALFIPGLLLLGAGWRLAQLRRVLTHDPAGGVLVIELQDKRGRIPREIRRRPADCYVQLAHVRFGSREGHGVHGGAVGLVGVSLLLIQRQLQREWYGIRVSVGSVRFFLACERSLQDLADARVQLPPYLEELGVGETGELWLRGRTRFLPRARSRRPGAESAGR